MVNVTGNNQWGEKNYPLDQELCAALLECTKLKYNHNKKLEYLQRECGLKIGLTKLRDIESQLKIPTVWKPQLSCAEIEQAAIDIITRDITKGNGPNAIKSMLWDNEVLIPHDTVHKLMHRLAPDRFAMWAPGAKKNQIPHIGLISLGPYHEILADGHKKLNGQALCMSNIRFGIYGYRDKFSGDILKLVVMPDCCSAAPLAHLYLDLICEIGRVPIKLTTDMGPEQGWQQSIQDALRRLFGLDIDPDVFATATAIKSIHNMVIESLWKWLQSSVGKNLREIMELGCDLHIFQPQTPFHIDLFYWIFVPVVQKELDKFQSYWNHHHVCWQSTKNMPSKHVPANAMQLPKKYNPNATDSLISIPQEAQDTCREMIKAEIGPKEDYFTWYSTNFDHATHAAYTNILSPPIELNNAWNVFSDMANVLKTDLA
ncbi:hypothetical protein FA15DRAFT_582881 [Coprinopsis marcescibilis]|uniref:Integrase core domain-containing protein n=1 Tax=Coprinopsis marcescibilis TaxID=230819 RepID=A0A5C3L8R8_COPMA|nr:hypothetical protein FA15DRAFT_582881 [Coprinopsis marcescibilis]